MSFDTFVSTIKRRFHDFGEPEFYQEGGRHIAIFPEGVFIIGNTIAVKVQVKWGSNHIAYALL